MAFFVGKLDILVAISYNQYSLGKKAVKKGEKLGKMKTYNELFNENIKYTISTGIKLLHDFPESRKSLKHFLKYFPQATKLRESNRKQGIIVPQLLIISTTAMCNLNCVGCYAKKTRHKKEQEITKQQITTLFSQAVEAGCSVVLLAGGEPLLSKDWLDALAGQPELLGLVFTNGTLLNNKRADWFAEKRNMVPLFSIEGDWQETDHRRGNGVASQVECAMQLLHQRNIPFGISVTAGDHNIEKITDYVFLDEFVALGCRLFIFPEYVPVDDNDLLKVLSEKNKEKLQDFCRHTAIEKKLLMIQFPGDETPFDGCLAAGRGFAHISVDGDLEPCPFAEYSDRNVFATSLKEALTSPLFAKIRGESHLLSEKVGGCALRDLKLQDH